MSEIHTTPNKFKDRILARTAQVLSGPISSGSDFFIHKMSGGKYKPELSQFFGPSKRNEEISVTLENVSKTLTDIDRNLSDGENFIAEDFIKWKCAKQEVENVLGMQVSNYAVFDKKEGRHILFAEDGDNMIPVFLPSQVDQVSLWTGFLGFGQEYKKVESASDSVSRELTINQILNEEGYNLDGMQVRKMCSVTNDFEMRRNALYEREGDMFEELREKGAMSIGELQTVSRLLISNGTQFIDGKIEVDINLESMWLKSRMLSHKNYSESQTELNKYLSEVVYFKLIQKYFNENPALVEKFMQTPEYLSLRKDFLNSHINGHGQSERQIASAMLSNYCLLKFENTDVQESPSQKYTKNKTDFVEKIEAFFENNNFEVPNSLAQVSDALKDKDIICKSLKAEDKAKAIADAQESLIKITNEMWRHLETRKIFNWLIEHSPFDLVEDDQKATKVVRTIIVNLGLASVPGEKRFTMGSYLTNVPYYPQGSEVLPFDSEESVYAKVEDSLRHIFNGTILATEASEQSAYESQVARIYTEGATLLRFLSGDSRVPKNIQEFIKTITSDDLGIRIMERYGPIANQDPQIINRFFKDGFDRFQTMTQHRYVTDFVRGVETNLIELTSGSVIKKTKRKFVDNWKNYDFSQVPEDVLQKAIDMTLQNGSHRIDFLNHEISERKTLKDNQELLEKIFGWNTYDMQFLRWEKFWNIWNTLGGAWDCICFMRKPIFNSGTFKQH